MLFLLIATVSNAAEVYQVTYACDGDTVKLRAVEAREESEINYALVTSMLPSEIKPMA